MLKLIFALLLLLISLLVLFPAPANFLWLVAVVLTNFPYVFMVLAAISFYLGTKATKYHWPIMLISLASFIIYTLPIVAAYRQKSNVPLAMKNIFPVKDERSLPTVFNFFKMFSANVNMSYKTFIYKNIDAKDLTADFYPSSLKISS